MRSKRFLFFIFFLNLFFLFSSTVALAALDKEERILIKLINDYRKNNNQKELKVSKKLVRSADYMAKNMSDSSSELDAQNRTSSQRAAFYGYTGNVIENLAVGYTSAENVFEGWKNSDTYRERMLSSNHRAFGVAFEEKNDSYRGYWSCVFGDTANKKDSLDKEDYSELKELKITVTDTNKNGLEKVKIKIFIKKNGKAKTLAEGKTDKKGEAEISYGPGSDKNIYIKASKSGYSSYTKKISTTSKTIKLWLKN